MLVETFEITAIQAQRELHFYFETQSFQLFVLLNFGSGVVGDPARRKILMSPKLLIFSCHKVATFSRVNAFGKSRVCSKK